MSGPDIIDTFTHETDSIGGWASGVVWASGDVEGATRVRVRCAPTPAGFDRTVLTVVPWRGIAATAAAIQRDLSSLRRPPGRWWVEYLDATGQTIRGAGASQTVKESVVSEGNSNGKPSNPQLPASLGGATAIMAGAQVVAAVKDTEDAGVPQAAHVGIALAKAWSDRGQMESNAGQLESALECVRDLVGLTVGQERVRMEVLGESLVAVQALTQENSTLRQQVAILQMELKLARNGEQGGGNGAGFREVEGMLKEVQGTIDRGIAVAALKRAAKNEKTSTNPENQVSDSTKLFETYMTGALPAEAFAVVIVSTQKPADVERLVALGAALTSEVEKRKGTQDNHKK